MHLHIDGLAGAVGRNSLECSIYLEIVGRCRIRMFLGLSLENLIHDCRCNSKFILDCEGGLLCHNYGLHHTEITIRKLNRNCSSSL